jgi:hypothetical protein
MFQQNMLQGRPQNQTGTPTQQQANTQAQQSQQQAQMLALQRTAAQAMAAAAAAGNNNNNTNNNTNSNNNNTTNNNTNGGTTGTNTAAQIAANASAAQQQIPLSVLQNLNMGTVNQAAVSMSPRQFQVYLARQIAMHQGPNGQQQNAQQGAGTPQFNQNTNIDANALLNMNNQNFRPPVSGASGSPMQANNFAAVSIYLRRIRIGD